MASLTAARVTPPQAPDTLEDVLLTALIWACRELPKGGSLPYAAAVSASVVSEYLEKVIDFAKAVRHERDMDELPEYRLNRQDEREALRRYIAGV